MRSLLATPLDWMLADWWVRIDRAHKVGFVAAACVSLLAFGFEMTNLTLHHDDLIHLLVQAPLVGYYLGRFGHAWLFYYGENGYFLPFLQMVVSIVLMGVYGSVVAHLWGVRKAMDIALIAAILCVFPYMAQIYQYNSAMVAYPAAHLLVAVAVLLSVRAGVVPVAIASVLYLAAFSIYQAVAANAATIFLFWFLGKLLFKERGEPFASGAMVRSTAAVIISVVAGGVIYVAIVASLNIHFDSSQAADQAFSLSSRLHHGFQLVYAVSEVLRGSRSFFFWSENYFPDSLKKLQLVLMFGAAVFCLWLPGRAWAKLTALTLLAVASFAPRTLQLLHPQGSYHNLTLTAYALVIAGAVMIIARSGRTAARNASTVVAVVLIAGYVVQCNWISTVNYLNTLAHYTTLTEVLARLRSLPEAGWDGKKVAVVGTYDMPSVFPFKPATGVASEFMDAVHMDRLARLMRDEVRFVQADPTTPKALDYAAAHAPWPDPGSVGVVDGIGVIVFSKN